ncbi:hypothetical protein BpHYR1_047437 [Brachionus plicatilis]|uniref:Uncharacterized protein n=1 Tax=Brachionus plicatilis TaxID=10195 RepID=A0A3M7T8Y9_BRAPC|nr:hypothetical protein BpHYR1_047437 [Brachionus plicatilis]
MVLFIVDSVIVLCLCLPLLSLSNINTTFSSNLFLTFWVLLSIEKSFLSSNEAISIFIIFYMIKQDRD